MTAVLTSSAASKRLLRAPIAARKLDGMVTMQDLLDRLGGIPAERVRLQPPPGTAKQKDLLDPKQRECRPIRLELVDGVLVEKAVMGSSDSRLAAVLVGYLFHYLLKNNVGAVNAGGDAYIKLERDLIRVPDVWFVRWDALPQRQFPKVPCPELIADLVVEVLSKSNTKKEIERKRQDFFDHGARLFWVVDPRKQTVTVYRSVHESEILRLDDDVSGEGVLPGFSLSIREWFQVAQDGTKPPAKKK